VTMAAMVVAQGALEVTDETLARAARGGDEAAYSLLVARYRDIAFAYAAARLRDREEAEDAAQEAFVRAYLALGRYRPGASWGAWLMAIVRNHCTDLERRRRGRRTEPLTDEWLAEGPTPEGLALAAESRQRLSEAVGALPEKYRVPLLMHYGSCRTYREIALALDLPESTIVGRMAGALKLLRRRLGEEAR
jgi:RNA polymerase sigma-70 factor, ECF subfamily